jgi:hypothetical protein
MTNQVDQFYVITDQNSIQEVKTTKKGEVYFTYNGPAGILRSDLIKPDHVCELKLTDADVQATPLHETTVTLDTTVNEGAPIVGETYQLKIAISQAFDMAEDSMYYKYAVAHAGANDEAKDIYLKLVKSLCANFARENVKYFAFGLKGEAGVEVYDVTGATEKAIDGTTVKVDPDTATGVVIYELPQDWNLALMPKKGVNYTVYTDTVLEDGVEVKWGVVEHVPSEGRSIANGYTIADMEYFYMGERGDQYRMFAAPQDRIPTRLLVDSTKAYDVINLHYYFTDSLGGVQKSEKDITIVCLSGTGASVISPLVEALGCSYTHVTTEGATVVTA